MSETGLDEMASLQKQIETMQHELDELKDKYQISLQDTKFIQLEKKEIEKELDEVKQENTELKEKNVELQNITSTMEIERTQVLRPTLLDLETSHNEQSKLQKELSSEKAMIKKLNTENIQIKEENKKYKIGLEKYDVKLRKKEENTQNNIKILVEQIEALKDENEALNKKLLKCELDLYTIRKNPVHCMNDDEKVQIQSSLLHHMEDSIEIMVTNIGELNNASNNNTPNQAEQDQYHSDTPINIDELQPLMISEHNTPNQNTSNQNTPNQRCTDQISGRKTSITLTLNDLATVMEQQRRSSGLYMKHSTDSLTSLRSQLLTIQSSRSILETGNTDIGDGEHLEPDDLEIDEIKRKQQEIERLKQENKLLIDTHLEIQEEYKKKLDKKQKRIKSLNEQNETLKMKMSKKSCNLVPWCK